MIDIVSDQVEDYNYFLEALSVLQNIIWGVMTCK
jgi:hypothetical protein